MCSCVCACVCCAYEGVCVLGGRKQSQVWLLVHLQPPLQGKVPHVTTPLFFHHCAPQNLHPPKHKHTHPSHFHWLACVWFSFSYCLSVCLLGFKIFCWLAFTCCDLSVFCWFVLCVIAAYRWCFMDPLKQFNESDVSRADKQAVNLWKTMWMMKWSWEHSQVDYRSKI